MPRRRKTEPFRPSPLAGTNGQLMVMAAHRYCLGRASYIVGAAEEWLRANWSEFEDNTRRVLVRDTIEHLQRHGQIEHLCDRQTWFEFARWAWDQLDDEGRRWVQYETRCRHLPLPWESPEARAE